MRSNQTLFQEALNVFRKCNCENYRCVPSCHSSSVIYNSDAYIYSNTSPFFSCHFSTSTFTPLHSCNSLSYFTGLTLQNKTYEELRKYALSLINLPTINTSAAEPLRRKKSRMLWDAANLNEFKVIILTDYSSSYLGDSRGLIFTQNFRPLLAHNSRNTAAARGSSACK